MVKQVNVEIASHHREDREDMPCSSAGDRRARNLVPLVDAMAHADCLVCRRADNHTDSPDAPNAKKTPTEILQTGPCGHPFLARQARRAAKRIGA